VTLTGGYNLATVLLAMVLASLEMPKELVLDYGLEAVVAAASPFASQVGSQVLVSATRLVESKITEANPWLIRYSISLSDAGPGGHGRVRGIAPEARSPFGRDPRRQHYRCNSDPHSRWATLPSRRRKRTNGERLEREHLAREIQRRG